MAQARDTRSVKKSRPPRRHGMRDSTPCHDAVQLIEEHHRVLRRLMSRFARSRDGARRIHLAERICSEAMVHARLEDEILAPAFLAVTGDVDTHHRAEVTRNTCTMLIASFGGPGMRGEHLETRMEIIGDVIRRHMHEEQKPDGLLAAIRAAGMDLRTLGQCMRVRRYLLTNGAPLRLRPRAPARRSVHDVAPGDSGTIEPAGTGASATSAPA